MTDSIKQLFDKLSHLNIDYKLFEHEAFYTVDESSKLKSDLDLKGAHTKNLFLRDKKRKIFSRCRPFILVLLLYFLTNFLFHLKQS